MLLCYPSDWRSICTDQQMFTKCLYLCKVLSSFYLDVLIMHPFSKCSAIGRRQTSFPNETFLSLGFRCLEMPCGNSLTKDDINCLWNTIFSGNTDPHCQRTHSSLGSREEREREREEMESTLILLHSLGIPGVSDDLQRALGVLLRNHRHIPKTSLFWSAWWGQAYGCLQVYFHPSNHGWERKRSLLTLPPISFCTRILFL